MGNKLTKQGDQLARGAEYFEGLLNRPLPPVDAEIMKAQDTLQISGAGCIPAEILKTDINTNVA